MEMKNQAGFLAAFCLLWAGLSTPAAAQRAHNDGFCRRDGQMYVLRNGQLRPLLREARLPTGTIVTKDGFLLAKSGERTELGEGQGCDLRGNVVAVEPAPGGSLALGKKAAPAGPPAPSAVAPVLAPEPEPAGDNPDPEQERDEADARDQPGQPGKDEEEKKREEQAREQRQKAEEQQREQAKRREEDEREARKEEKEQRKKERKGDD